MVPATIPLSSSRRRYFRARQLSMYDPRPKKFSMGKAFFAAIEISVYAGICSDAYLLATTVEEE
jgi:hypothetical protein